MKKRSHQKRTWGTGYPEAPSANYGTKTSKPLDGVHHLDVAIIKSDFTFMLFCTGSLFRLRSLCGQHR